MSATFAVTEMPAAASPAARWALASLSLSMLMPSLATSIVNAGLPALAQAFNATFPAVQWIVLAYLLTLTALIVSVGRLGDLLGRRRLLLTGISVFTVASLLCGVAPSLEFLVAARALQGVGAAVMMALTVALVGETVRKERTGSAMGLLGSMSAVGTTLGPSLGGLLVAGPGWRTLFLVNVPLGVLNLFLAHRSLPADRPQDDSVFRISVSRGGLGLPQRMEMRLGRPRLALLELRKTALVLFTESSRDRPASPTGRMSFDTPGTFLLALTLVAYALAMTLGRGQFGALNGMLLLATVAGAALFVQAERRSASPLVNLPLFRDAALRTNLALSALVSTVLMATLVVGPFYLSRGLGLPAAWVGAVMSVGPLMAALTGVPAGRLVDRLGTRPMTAAGLTGVAAGSFALALLPLRFGVAGYLLPMVVLTMGYALFQTANNTAVLTDRQSEQRGVVSGLLNLSRNLGLVTGASLMGAVFAWAAGTSDLASASPEAVSMGLRATFAVATVLMVGARFARGDG